MALLLTLLCPSRSFSADSPSAVRFAVPVLCTENPAARTKVRGTAVVVDPTGLILTAGHVILESRPLCVLTVVVPNDDWSRALAFHPFSVQHCVTNELLDIALCRIQPIENVRDWAYVRSGRIRIRSLPPDSPVTITGFTGWGFSPTVVRARLTSPQQLYRRQDGCYCDFAVNVITHAGMSGSPLVTEQGDVIGLITTAGTGRFRGISFGTSLERAAAFLRKAGLNPARASNIEGPD